MAAIARTDLPLPNPRRGKVRDLYDLPSVPGAPERLLIVATDRLSAFDVVLPTPIPGKGEILTRLSRQWMRWIEKQGICRTHVAGQSLAEAAPDLPADLVRDLEPRSVVARKARVVPVECVVRGYLEGSGWREYQETGAVCGVSLPPGLRQCDRLPEPIFTPATKAEQGAHDENISFDRACEIAGALLMRRLRELSLAIYAAAAERAQARGVIIADTKFEFGLLPEEESLGGEPILVDEALTPDSSRFWPAESYTPGGPQPSFDKQFVREHLEALVAEGKWDKSPPGPELPEEIVRATRERYLEAERRLFPDGDA
jgi:phosphoribosylaminoimidazole-succinocarboxamide synthase